MPDIHSNDIKTQAGLVELVPTPSREGVVDGKIGPEQADWPTSFSEKGGGGGTYLTAKLGDPVIDPETGLANMRIGGAKAPVQAVDVGARAMDAKQREALEAILSKADKRSPIIVGVQAGNPPVFIPFVVTAGDATQIKVREAIPAARAAASKIVDTAAPRPADIAKDVSNLSLPPAAAPSGAGARQWLDASIGKGMLDAVAALEAKGHAVAEGPGTHYSRDDYGVMKSMGMAIGENVNKAAGHSVFGLGAILGSHEKIPVTQLLAHPQAGCVLDVSAGHGPDHIGVTFKDNDGQFKVLECADGRLRVSGLEEFVRAQGEAGSTVAATPMRSLASDRGMAAVEADMVKLVAGMAEHAPAQAQDMPQMATK
jgi:hypothetical protein